MSLRACRLNELIKNGTALLDGFHKPLFFLAYDLDNPAAIAFKFRISP